MWQPYLRVIAAQAGQALHVLDRFHITLHLNQALDQVRRAEYGRLRGRPLAKRLKKMRWQLLKRGSRVRGKARERLDALLASKLATARAWNLKDCFEYLWHYRSAIWAGAFMDYWCTRAMRSRLEPMQKVARMLRTHEDLLLNWFRAKGEIFNLFFKQALRSPQDISTQMTMRKTSKRQPPTRKWPALRWCLK
jgi:transposase